MNVDAMEMFGSALLDYLNGDTEAQPWVHRDDGHSDTLAAAACFAIVPEEGEIDRLAIEACQSPVLDVGAGAGRHSLVLQKRGHQVTAIEISQSAVQVLKRREVANVVHADVLSYKGGPFSTVLCLGRTVGLVERLSGVVPLLRHLTAMLGAGGQLLFDSTDFRRNAEPHHVAYRAARAQAGGYPGEVTIRFEYRGQKSPWFGWIHIDPDTLLEVTASAGLRCDILRQETAGQYLARVTLA